MDACWHLGVMGEGERGVEGRWPQRVMRAERGKWRGSGLLNGEWRPSSGWILAPGRDGGAEQGVEGCRTTGCDGGK